MRINIVTEEEKKSWVLYMMSTMWKKYLPNCTMTARVPDPKAHVNFYVNWSLFRKKTQGLDIGWFTHLEPRSRSEWNSKANHMDYCVCPSKNTLKLLPPNKSKVIKHGIDDIYQTRPTRFGLVGRAYDSGRKRFNLLDQLTEIPHAEYMITDGNVSREDMPKFYDSIDYLLVLSNNEGGPVPVLEALAKNKPVIAPDVGWCWEYPCIRYNSVEHLMETISSLCAPIDTERMWTDSASELVKVFQSLV